jgi:hypothetical protein
MISPQRKSAGFEIKREVREVRELRELRNE